jgi:hypothetical protein
MILRKLGLHALELEAGPFTFLLLDCVPVAYRENGRAYRSSQYFRKGVTKAINKWLKGQDADGTPQDHIVAVFQSISRFGPQVETDRRQTERRALADTRGPVDQLAEALRAVLNGRD